MVKLNLINSEKTLKIHRLTRFFVQPATDPSPDRFWIWIDGPILYLDKLRLAYPGITFEKIPNARAPGYSWCAEVRGMSVSAFDDLCLFMAVSHRTLLVEGLLDECYALAWHSRPGKPGKPALTTLGQWVHMAKSYGDGIERPGSVPMAGLIADQMEEFIKRHPIYRRCGGLAAAPPSNPDKAFDLPTEIAQVLMENIRIPFYKHALKKTRRTAQMKNCLTREDKIDNISGSIICLDSSVIGKTILVIDDILDDGFTLAECAKALRTAGAARVYGLVATKTLRSRFR